MDLKASDHPITAWRSSHGRQVVRKAPASTDLVGKAAERSYSKSTAESDLVDKEVSIPRW